MNPTPGGLHKKWIASFLLAFLTPVIISPLAWPRGDGGFKIGIVEIENGAMSVASSSGSGPSPRRRRPRPSPCLGPLSSHVDLR